MTNRIDHTHCSHSATSRARKACRAMHLGVLNDARREYIANGETDQYDELIHRVALVFNLPVPDAYTLVEEGAM